MQRSVHNLFTLAAFAWLTTTALAQGTAFTYQGRLLNAGNTANGSYDLTFALYDAGTNGNLISGPLTNSATVISNGLFTVELDFGANFPGADRWLQISVRTNGDANFTTLTARQRLTPTPYAITAGNVQAGGITTTMLAAGAVTSDKIAAGAVKGFQIDDGGVAAYQGFQNAVQSVGGDSSLTFAGLFPVVTTNGVAPSFALTINGSTFGTVVGFSGTEGISVPSAYVVEVKSSGAPVNPDAQVGLPGRLTYTRNGRVTSFAGTITAFALSSASGANLLYTLRIESPLAYMVLTTDYRIYQNLTVPAVASTLYSNLTTNTVTQVLVGSYSVHENLIQYAETGLNFFNRLLEHEGVFYFFNQSTNPPNLIFGDGTAAYLSAPNSPFAYYGDTDTNVQPAAEYIRTFQKAIHQSTLKSVVNTYNFQTPAAVLLAENAGPEGVGELYEFDTTVPTAAYDAQIAQVRQERHNAERAAISGSGTIPDLRAGYTFALTDLTSAGAGGTYVVTAVHHAGFVRVINGVSSLSYGNHFEAILASQTFRPARKTPRPLAQPCTAVITGAAGETIYVDKYGRVKVSFHWDRSGINNENSIGWLRATSPMAGASHGMIFLPRIGDEVLVSFIQGDPDQPVVTGSLYNGANPPPYTLPLNKTVSGIRSAGTDRQINEIQFDDAAGKQSFLISGAKDLIVHANNDLVLAALHQVLISGPLTAGSLSASSLSINGGTIFTNLLAGQAIVGGSPTFQTSVTITFPKPFLRTPTVMVSASNDPGWNVNDTFAATVRSVSPSGCVVNVVRVDLAGGWSQLLRVNWIAWE